MPRKKKTNQESRVESRESRVKRIKSPNSPLSTPDSPLVIQFVGKHKVLNKETGLEETVTRKAPTRRRNGARLIELPGSTEQKSGFTHPDAEFLLTAYPKDFKRKKSKGDK